MASRHMPEKTAACIKEQSDMDKITSLNKGRQLYDILKSDILEGRYATGDKLPSIRELAQRYGLSKNTGSIR